MEGGDDHFQLLEAARVINPADVRPPEVARFINTVRGGNPARPLVSVQIPLDPYPTFRLEKAVCNHGFFMMAPNRWDPATKALARPLRLDGSPSSPSVAVVVRHENNALRVYIDRVQPPANLAPVVDQVKRMLRLSPADEVASARFQSLYPEAAAHGFGRLFRAPTLFEDIVKSLLLSNCGWGRSLDMAKELCELGSRTSDGDSLQNFPDAKEVRQLLLDVQSLKKCKLGYRAEILSSVVDRVLKGRLQLHELQDVSLVMAELLKVRGVGSFVAANVSICMGFYSAIPIDTETYRHFCKVHGVQDPTQRTIMDRYHKYAPYDSLAYWFEHHMLYEGEFGDLSELAPSSYRLVTSRPGDQHRKTESKLLLLTKSAPQSKRIVKKKKKKGRYEKKSRKLLLTM